ncbi:prolyl-tRNA synthetase [Candidatus Saccharibacteria bacterium]|nr:prolyl-tRNA synthetase [Candidatus Saccharibacteria bacterium]
MRLSHNFTKTLREAPADEVALNAQLLIRAGFVYKEMAGAYAYLPLGIRVLEKIKQIVREEMNVIDSQEIIMTSLQNKAVWEKSGRWSDEKVDVWFKSKLQDGTDVGFGWTHEEPIIEMMQQYIQSYKDLPVSVYQFQTKMRNELRAKSGIMRGREFIMKDMYSFHANTEDLAGYYDKVIQAYERTYDRLGIGDDTYMTFASGGAFTKFSHEFQTICDAGEDVIYLHRGKNIAVNEEVLDEAIEELGLDKKDLEPIKTAEVGNIFNFGTQKSEEMGLYFTDQAGTQNPACLGSYGIGITRVMGVIAEKFSDEHGLVWPDNIAPARVYLVQIGDVENQVNELYNKLQQAGIETIWDDRDMRPGEKFADADLIGIPHRVVVSPKTLEAGKLEYKSRSKSESQLIDEPTLFKLLSV